MKSFKYLVAILSVGLFMSCGVNNAPIAPTQQTNLIIDTPSSSTTPNIVEVDSNYFEETLNSQATVAPAGIQITPNISLLAPGESTTFQVYFTDSSGKNLRLAKASEVDLKSTGTGYVFTWTSDGKLKVTTPSGLSKSLWNLKLKSNPNIYAEASVEVPSLRAGVVKLNASSVSFPKTTVNPIGMTATALTALFAPFTPEEVLGQLQNIPSQAPRYPVVLTDSAAKNLKVGTLVAGWNGLEIFGKVEAVIASRGGKTLVTIRVVMPSEVFSSYAQNSNLTALKSSGFSPTSLINSNGLEAFGGNSSVISKSTRVNLSKGSTNAWKCTNTSSVSGSSFGSSDLTIEPILSLGLGGDVSLNNFNISLDGEVGIHAVANPTVTGTLGIICKFDKPLEIPIGTLGGVLGMLFHINLDFNPSISGTVTVDAKALGGEATVKAGIIMPLLPQVKAPTLTKTFDYQLNPTTNLDPRDVDGPSGSLGLKANISGETSLIIGPGSPTINTWITTVLNTFTNVQATLGLNWTADQLISLEGKLDPKISFDSQVITMRRALELGAGGKPSATLSGDIEASIGVKGWIIDQINYLTQGINGAQIKPITGSFNIFNASAKTPENTQADVTADNGGSATLAFAWTDGDVSKVQLGKLPQNSLHAKTTSGSGGSVSYSTAECTTPDGIKANILGLGTLDFTLFKISGLPFNSGKEVAVCNTALEVTQPAPMSTHILTSTFTSFLVNNKGIGKLKYEITAPTDPTHFSLSPSSGEIGSGSSDTINVKGTCGSTPDTYTDIVKVRDTGTRRVLPVNLKLDCQIGQLYHFGIANISFISEMIKSVCQSPNVQIISSASGYFIATYDIINGNPNYTSQIQRNIITTGTTPCFQGVAPPNWVGDAWWYNLLDMSRQRENYIASDHEKIFNEFLSQKSTTERLKYKWVGPIIRYSGGNTPILDRIDLLCEYTP